MADGDPSLDAGYLGQQLAKCYEIMGRIHEAKYWYGQCVKENPEVRADCIKARERLKSATIDDLVPPEEYIADCLQIPQPPEALTFELATAAGFIPPTVTPPT